MTRTPTPGRPVGDRARASSTRRTPRGRRGGLAASLLAWLAAAATLAATAWVATRSVALGKAEAADRAGDPVLALRLALDHLGRRPWSREAARLAARNLSRLDFADEAEPYYRRAGALSPDDLHGRAYGLVRTNQRERAIAAYEQILAGRPDDILALRRLAGVQLTRNNLGAMLRLADRLLGLPDGVVLGLTLRGVAYHNDQDPEQAAAAFERILQVDPDLRALALPRPVFWGYLAQDLLASGRVADGLRYLGPAADREPDPALLTALGRFHELGGAMDQAERYDRRAVELGPESASARLALGKLLLKLGKRDEALTHLQRAAELAPRSYDTLYALDLAYSQLGRHAEAARVRGEAARLRGGRAAAPKPANSALPGYAL